ncbi:MAG: ABC transporter ATP-binding protein [Oscillospiraceae bacterium]|jgi:ABC-type Fe3+/spermidine/putrescine transport system ATPase subunit|nr:ABC transporter ATP-binding protein [Oscillospiraceae bacterium]
MSYLHLNQITKTYKISHAPVLNALELSAEKGEILVILGASGSGKTTALKIVSGLERQDSGTVKLDGAIIDALRPEQRSTPMVFQKSLLFRNMTVAENISFAPRLNRTLSKQELRRKTAEMLELLRLDGLGSKRVSELSGGQEQRVSLGRALMTDPKLLLLDEPLSALDASLKWALLPRIRELNRRLGTTMLYVTHDQAEASAVASRIAFLHGGRVTRVAEPYAFYSRPSSRIEAEFFGWENFVPAVKSAAMVKCALGGFAPDGADSAADGSGFLCIRPEAAVNVGSGALRGVVCSALPQGLETLYSADCNGVTLKLSANSRRIYAPGEEFRFDLDPLMMWFVKN